MLNASLVRNSGHRKVSLLEVANEVGPVFCARKPHFDSVSRVNLRVPPLDFPLRLLRAPGSRTPDGRRGCSRDDHRTEVATTAPGRSGPLLGEGVTEFARTTAK